MRLAWYVGASTALAAAVVTSAFYQRANFYSAMVYMSQSNLCLMILVNLIFLVYISFMYGLQRLCFGPLRPVEVEQLYEKAWFAVTETCLAMTVFREDLGAFFVIMFTALITGKVWGWIGEGRVEVLEQQPPANPRLFHTRLSISLTVSVLYNFWLLHYSVQTVVQQARPSMMVMFLFEFIVVLVGSVHTGLRYIISLVEARVVKTQTQQQLEARRSQIREQRADILRRREAGEVAEGEEETLPSEDDVDEMDIEVPGWESRGQWVLLLDLIADLVKLCIYATFFFVLLMFYGLPIHIMRDLFMTTRSFVKRLGAILRYRQALKDMSKYPDATEEELSREDTCIICREQMRPWDSNAGQVERVRPKKLPCGHILHFGCLKSWLERQQVCPTCRSSVVMDPQAAGRPGQAGAFAQAPNLPNAQNQPPPANGPVPAVQDAQLNGQAAPAGQPAAANNRPRVRMFNLGPIRLGLAQGGVREFNEMAQRMGVQVDDPQQQPAMANPPPRQPTGGANGADLSTMEGVRNMIVQVDHRVQQEVRDLTQAIQNAQATQQELQYMNLLVAELERLRQANQLQQQTSGPSGQQPTPPPGPGPSTTAGGVQPPNPTSVIPPQPFPYTITVPPQFPLLPQGYQLPAWNPTPSVIPRMIPSGVTRHGGAPYGTAIPAGSPELPEGVVIPPGWSLLPLQRLDGATPAQGPTPLSATAVQLTMPEGTTLYNIQQGTADPPTLDSTNVNLEAQSASAAAPASTGANAQQDAPAGSSQSSTAGANAPPRQTEQPPVAAPTPVMPNVFGAGNSMPFGLTPAGQSSRSASGTSEPAAGSSTDDQDEETHDKAGPETEAHGAPNGSSSSSKGKARSATVEDAEEGS